VLENIPKLSPINIKLKKRFDLNKNIAKFIKIIPIIIKLTLYPYESIKSPKGGERIVDRISGIVVRRPATSIVVILSEWKCIIFSGR
jgi:hypothetical protein